MDSLNVISQNDPLIECLITVLARIANAHMHAVVMISEGIARVEPSRTLLTGVSPFVAVTLNVALQMA